MKQYNRALDLMALAAVKFTEGKTTLAAGLMVKATKEPSFARAIAIIEASNGQAYTTAKTAAKVKAKKRALASEEDKALEGLIGEQDDVAEEEEHGEPEGEPEDVEDDSIGEEAVEDTEEEGEESAVGASSFARVLASMSKPKVKAKRK